MNFPSSSPGAPRRPSGDHQQQQREAVGRRAGGASNGQHRVRFPDNLGSDGAAGRRCRVADGVGPLQVLTGWFTAYIALCCIAGVSTLLAILHVVVRPFSAAVYRRLVCQLGAASFIDSMSLLLPNTRIYLTGDSDLPTPVGTSLLVSNHLVDGDWWAIFLLGRCIGLRGSIKVFMRNEYLNVCLPPTEGGSGSANGTANGTSASSAGAPLAITSSCTFNSSKPASSNLKPPPPSSTNGTASAFSNGSSSATHTMMAGSGSPSSSHKHPQDLSILAKLLHLWLEFPLINEEDYSSNREQLFHLLRSFAEHDGATAAPTHLLFFPEGWSLHNGADRASILKISNDFAQREGRPQLKHLLLPRARGFNSSLECLRESSPVVYDITMVCLVVRLKTLRWPFCVNAPSRYHIRCFVVQANVGYDGSLPPSIRLSAPSLWSHFRRTFPREIHIRVKRYSMEEVLQDRSWLDKRWAEKDRLLAHFARHQNFPVDGRGYARYRVLDSRLYSVEGSIVSLLRLLLVPLAVPLLLFLSIPLVWTFGWIWLVHKLYRLVFPDPKLHDTAFGTDIAVAEESAQTPGSSSAGTPYMPATPFASPSVTSWRDLFSPLNNNSSSSGT
jgi:hypothetical protein